MHGLTVVVKTAVVEDPIHLYQPHMVIAAENPDMRSSQRCAEVTGSTDGDRLVDVDPG
jgi:hypothetical protein